MYQEAAHFLYHQNPLVRVTVTRDLYCSAPSSRCLSLYGLPVLAEYEKVWELKYHAMEIDLVLSTRSSNCRNVDTSSFIFARKDFPLFCRSLLLYEMTYPGMLSKLNLAIKPNQFGKYHPDERTFPCHASTISQTREILEPLRSLYDIQSLTIKGYLPKQDRESLSKDVSKPHPTTANMWAKTQFMYASASSVFNEDSFARSISRYATVLNELSNLFDHTAIEPYALGGIAFWQLEYAMKFAIWRDLAVANLELADYDIAHD